MNRFHKPMTWCAVITLILDFLAKILFIAKTAFQSDFESEEWDEWYYFSGNYAVFFLFFLIVIAVSLLITLPRLNLRKVNKKGLQIRESWTGIVIISCTYGLLSLFSLYIVCNFFIGAGIIDTLIWSFGEKDAEGNIQGILFSLLIILFAFVAGFLGIRRRKRVSSETPNDISIADLTSTEAPYLFLRSFEIEGNDLVGANMSAVTLRSSDDFLFSAFKGHKQPVISLADPDYHLSGGSIKFQAEDEHWKEAIIEILKSAKAVIMIEGKTEGLNWEVDNIKQYVSPNRFFVATLPTEFRTKSWYYQDGFLLRSKKKKRAEIEYAFQFIWEGFAERLGKADIHLPHQNPGDFHIFSFDGEWNVCKEAQLASSEDLYMFISTQLISQSIPISLCDYHALYRAIRGYEIKEGLSEKAIRRFNQAPIVLLSVEIAYVLIVLLLF